MAAETHQRESTIPPEPDRYPVVLVDAGPTRGRGPSQALTTRGYKVGTAADASGALELVARQGPSVLVVDSDDFGGGISTASRIARGRDDVELVLAARATPETLLRVIELGVFRFLRKPYDDEELFAAVAGAGNRLFLRLDRRRRIALLETRNRELEVAVARLERSETRLALAERLASVGQFAAALGHEMNGPLAYVQTNLDLVRGWVAELEEGVDRATDDTWSDDPSPATRRWGERLGQMREALDDCDTGLRFMRQLSRDLGSVARYRIDERSAFDLNEVVSTACRIARVKVRPPHRLDVVPSRLPVGVFASQGRIAQVVLNLVNNAIDATAPDRVNVITVTTGQRGDEAYVAVSDTGVGISPDLRDRIFDPYVSFREGGTGIGLGVVRHVVDEHGGVVDVESEPGVGSCFRVRLRAFDVPEVDTGVSTSNPPRIAASGRILLVDDDELILRGVGRALAGFAITSVSSTAAALAELERDLPDLVVTDVDMPGLDGVAFYAQACRRHPALADRFLFITGDPSRVPEGLGRVLEKPFGAARLRKTVLKSLG